MTLRYLALGGINGRGWSLLLLPGALRNIRENEACVQQIVYPNGRVKMLRCLSMTKLEQWLFNKIDRGLLPTQLCSRVQFWVECQIRFSRSLRVIILARYILEDGSHVFLSLLYVSGSALQCVFFLRSTISSFA